MKLFLFALLLTALPVAFAQTEPAQPWYPNGVVIQNPSPATLAAMQAQAEYMNHMAVQFGCPLLLSAASVAAPAGYLPVGQRRPDDGTLTLHFRNQSGKAIRSAAITATVKVKTNIYALDAHPIALQLTFSGTNDVDLRLNQSTQIALPPRYYLFGLATVSLDHVTYEDGTNWTAPRNNYCGTQAQRIVQAK
jgi:hypothetical protein